MRYLFVFSLLPLLTACPEDDILGRGDGGPPRVIDAGPAPHELPIYPGDQFRYQGLIAVTQGCAEGHVVGLLLRLSSGVSSRVSERGGEAAV